MTPEDKKNFLNTLRWGFILWLFGYALGFVFFAFVPREQIGWYILPLGLALMLWVLFKKISRPKFMCYIGLGIVWTVMAIVLDYLFIVKLLSSADYYKLDIYVYYALTLLVPIAVGWLKMKGAGHTEKKTGKTILVDAIDGLLSDTGEVFAEMHKLLETYPNKKIIVTGADDEGFKRYKLDQAPYEVFTLKHNPEKTDPAYFRTLLERYHLKAEDVVYFEHNQAAVTSAESVGITAYWYDHTKKDLTALKAFLDGNV